MSGQIKDSRSIEFARRIIWAEQPKLHSDEDQSKMKEWFVHRVTTEDEVPWTTIKEAHDEAKKKVVGATEEQKVAIEEIQDFLSEYAYCVHHAN